jgi:tRNA-uridine 2-sulfurtransferase
MSGGVDSSVTAALLHQQGYNVVGVTMRLYTPPGDSSTSFSRTDRCCSLETVDDARAVCATIGIPFYAMNFEREFSQYVIDYFAAEYARGRTPNPCLACNKWMKFEFLLQRAAAIGADYLATGHYARITHDEAGYHLLKGLDPGKDQSYVLYTLTQEQMKRLLLPMGHFHKSDTRRMAADFRLPVAEKEESQEICFVEDDDYRRFLRETIPGSIKPGPIVDESGKVIGEHQGIPLYTIGQRKGLGIYRAKPVFVLDIDAARNTLIVGPGEHLWRSTFTVEDVTFTSGSVPSLPLDCSIKIRYRSPETPGVVTAGVSGSIYKVVLDNPTRAITPGQAAVFYRDDEVLGGGTISGYHSDP